MSVDHQIHIANNSSTAIYVLPVPNTDWVWGDLGFDLAVTAVISIATAGTGTAAVAGNTVNSLSKLQKVLQMIKTLMAVTKIPREIGTWVSRGMNISKIAKAEAAKSVQQDLQNIKNFLEKDAIKIEPNEYKKVFGQRVWLPTRYITPSGIGSAFGASDMILFIIDVNLTRSVKFNTNGDYSWIVNDNDVERSEYGRIWQNDPRSGYYRFSIGDSLYSSQFLLPGQCLSSPNGDYDFVYLGSGYPVVYKRDKPKSESIIWGAVPSNTKTGKLCMQPDGNVVIYDSEGNPTWAHNRGYGVENEQQLCQLVMQNDGNLVVYSGEKVLWDIRSAQEDNNKFQEMITKEVSESLNRAFNLLKD
jgi:cell fate (sporulation/competence/biofilm development) regulator YmcA (YheA/YmcA/DUF963 family)